MNAIAFCKFHGLGNDFIIFDGIKNPPELIYTSAFRRKMCDRRFGIGADGILEIFPGDEAVSFSMTYYNSDGNVSSMCGNGARCALAYATRKGLIHANIGVFFSAFDGMHSGSYNNENCVVVKMTDVDTVIKYDQENYFVNTGSPHHVRYVTNLNSVDVIKEGSELRYSDIYAKEGTNVNFVEINELEEILVRTYERGVEAETMACGTGAVAVALITWYRRHPGSKTRANVMHAVKCNGGTISIQFAAENGNFIDIYLTGPACHVYDGVYIMDNPCL